MSEPVTKGREEYGPHFVQSVARALSVMRSFTADPISAAMDRLAPALVSRRVTPESAAEALVVRPENDAPRAAGEVVRVMEIPS